MAKVWRRILSASKPATFGDGSSDDRLELRSCCLLPRNDGLSLAPGRGPTLYCSANSDVVRHCLARPTEEVPHRKLRATISARNGKSILHTTGAGKILVVGIVKADRRPRNTAKVKKAAEVKTGIQAASDEAAVALLKTQAKVALVRKQIAEMEALKAEANRREPRAKKARLGANPGMEVGKTDSLSSKARPQLAMDFTFSKPQAVKQTKAESEEDEVPMQVLPGGLKFQVVRPGKGMEVCNGNVLQVKYEGMLASSGKRFDKGIIKFILGKGKVIKGWDQGTKGMLLGEKRTLFVPSYLGYGSKGTPDGQIPGNANLVFNIELIDIIPA